MWSGLVTVCPLLGHKLGKYKQKSKESKEVEDDAEPTEHTGLIFALATDTGCCTLSKLNTDILYVECVCSWALCVAPAKGRLYVRTSWMSQDVSDQQVRDNMLAFACSWRWLHCLVNLNVTAKLMENMCVFFNLPHLLTSCPGAWLRQSDGSPPGGKGGAPGVVLPPGRRGARCSVCPCCPSVARCCPCPSPSLTARLSTPHRCHRNGQKTEEKKTEKGKVKLFFNPTCFIYILCNSDSVGLSGMMSRLTHWASQILEFQGLISISVWKS